MTEKTYTQLEDQCFFKACRYVASVFIHFRGKTVIVCKKHAKRYGYSVEKR